MDSINLQKCCNQLLNLGKRNKLLYYSDTYSNRRVVSNCSADSLFQSLLNGDYFSFFDFDGYLNKNFVTYDSYNTDFSVRKEWMNRVRNEYQRKGDLDSLLLLPYRASLKSSRKRIIGQECSSIEDHGVSLLHLAIGRLHWKEKGKDGKPGEEVTSPLLLVPVSFYYDRNTHRDYLGRNGLNEVSCNNTLAFLFKQDYGIDLPEFDHDKFTVSSYLKNIEEMIAFKKDWYITNDLVLGLFTFSKIARYHDLKDNESFVTANPNVKCLFGQQDQELQASKEQDKEEKNRPFLPLHNVVDADSSQFAAIECAKQGDSFVLEGPPGTGKSQTITNIIAEARYDGKSVLFVAEKAAALDVVYHKLEKAGLDDFCLYLHGDVNKKDILSDISRVLHTPSCTVKENAWKIKENLQEEEKFLDSYSNAIYKNYPPRGDRVYQILGEASLLCSIPSPTFVFPDKNCLNRKFLDENIQKVNEVKDLCQKLSRKDEELPFYGIKEHPSDYDSKVQFQSQVEYLLSSLLSFQTSWNKISGLFGFSKDRPRKDVLNALKEKERIASLSFFDPARFDSSKRPLVSKARKVALNYLRQKKDSSFLKDKKEGILSLSGKDFEERFNNEYSSFLRFLKKGYRNDRKTLSSYSKKGKLNYVDAKNRASDLKQYQELLSELEKSIRELNDLFLDSERITEENIEAFSYDRNKLAKEKGITYQVISKENKSEFDETKYLLSSLPVEPKRRNSIVDFSNRFDPWKRNLLSLSYAEFVSTLEEFKNHRDDFSLNRKLYQLLDESKELGYFDFLDLYLKGDYSLDDLPSAFEKCFYTQLSHSLIENDPILKDASRRKIDEAETQFKKNDVTSFLIHQAEIKEQCALRIPNPNDVSGGIVSCFLKEANKKRRLISVRRMRSRFGTLIQRVKPCFRRSPLNVASFLHSDRHFDLVIFDEASQIFPWDAIGSIYRGKQLIICGDNKQRPPTNFFQVSLDHDDEGDEESDDISAFESVLDYAVAYPHKRLTWHYRSKNEELIAFSNQNFYEGSLTTFPSAIKKKKGFGVDFYYVANGNYKKNKRTNEVEAEKVVDLVCEDIRLYPDESIGIVARNISQQEEIQDQLEKRRNSDSALRKYGSEKNREKIFVKNLENVQGDERDRIIFSVGFSKDQDGRLSLNFGALNQQGGERRLNVAITRSRVNRQVVSSIHYYDIDLNRTDSIGRKRLRGYLEYAEKGTRLTLSVNQDERGNKSPFEEDIYQTLVSHGYLVDCQVGCSGYRIDFGVKHPTKNIYVLAIECDGANYHSAKNARDRNRLREQILEGKGWKFYRIWSTDWFRDRKNEEARLFAAVDDAIKNADSSVVDNTDITRDNKKEETVENEIEELPADLSQEKRKEEPLAPTTIEFVPERENEEPEMNHPESSSEKIEEVEEDNDDMDELPDEDDFLTVEEKPKFSLSDRFPSYQEEAVVASPDQLSASDVTWQRDYLKQKVFKIIKTEQPICKELILNKLSILLGRRKVTSVVTDAFHEIRFNLRYDGINRTTGKFTTYYWIDNQEVKLRINSTRSLDQIPDIEIRNGLIALVKREYLISYDELPKLFLKTIGYKSCPKQSCDDVAYFINQLLDEGKLLKDSNDNIRIPDK